MTSNFVGDAQSVEISNLLKLHDITNELSVNLKSVSDIIENLESLIGVSGCIKSNPQIGKKCFGCEYRIKDQERNAFNECWGKMSHAKNHILDLFSPSIQKINGEFALDYMVNEGKNEMSDWPFDLLSEGETSKRQKIQISSTLSNQEYFAPELKKQLNDLVFPIHFTDFETSTRAIPYHSGMHPYDMLAFQWSMHTLYEDGTLKHTSYINDKEGNPNDEFLRTLKDNLSDSGTFLMWHHHEKTVISSILRQNTTKNAENINIWKNPDMLDVYEYMATFINSDRMVDMNVMTKQYYFHPDMLNKTSIKKVLPAVWNHSKYIKNDKYVQEYFGSDLSFTDPYDFLDQGEDAIKAGTQAIIAYDKMVNAIKKKDDITLQQQKNMLLKYCQLDTLAMYIIYLHWKNSLKDI